MFQRSTTHLSHAPPRTDREIHLRTMRTAIHTSSAVCAHVDLPRASRRGDARRSGKRSPHVPFLYAYLPMKSAWKAVIRSTTSVISDSGGRKVVRKCHVPSFCPKPLPGTTTIPVASSSARA